MAPQDDRPRSTTARHWPGYLAVAAILAVAGVVVALLVFVDSENQPPPENLGAVADLTDKFIGETVTVEGEASEVEIAGEAFALEDRDGTDKNFVIVVPGPDTDAPSLEPEDRVVATGVVHGTDESGLIDTPDNYGLDFSSEPLDEYRDRAVIVSDEIERRG